jgi:hypothetical protein
MAAPATGYLLTVLLSDLDKLKSTAAAREMPHTIRGGQFSAALLCDTLLVILYQERGEEIN